MTAVRLLILRKTILCKELKVFSFRPPQQTTSLNCKRWAKLSFTSIQTAMILREKWVSTTAKFVHPLIDSHWSAGYELNFSQSREYNFLQKEAQPLSHPVNVQPFSSKLAGVIIWHQTIKAEDLWPKDNVFCIVMRHIFPRASSHFLYWVLFWGNELNTGWFLRVFPIFTSFLKHLVIAAQTNVSIFWFAISPHTFRK